MATGRLRRGACSAPGTRRRKVGRGFVYLDPSGARIIDPAVLEPARALVKRRRGGTA